MIVLKDGGDEWTVLLGVPPDKVNDMPGLLIKGEEHRWYTGGELPRGESFHEVFWEVLEEFRDSGQDLGDADTVRDMHRTAYERWGGDFGLNVWRAAEDWIDRRGWEN